MPFYNGVECVGACERAGYTCIEPSIFKKVARFYNANIEMWEDNAEDSYGRPFTIREWVLKIPDDRREEAVKELERSDVGLDPEFNPDFWLREIPCHTECPMIVCGYCGEVHHSRYTHEADCALIDTLADWKDEEMPFG